MLYREDLARLGYSDKNIDAIFRACGEVERWDDFSKPMIRVANFHAARERATYRGDRCSSHARESAGVSDDTTRCQRGARTRTADTAPARARSQTCKEVTTVNLNLPDRA